MTFFSFGGTWAEGRAEEGLAGADVELTMGFPNPLSSGGVAGPAQEVQKQKSPTSCHTPKPATPGLT